MTELRTTRLCLRMFTEEDVNVYATMCQDPEVMRFVGEGRPLTRAQTWLQVAGFIGHWQIAAMGCGHWRRRTPVSWWAGSDLYILPDGPALNSVGCWISLSGAAGWLWRRPMRLCTMAMKFWDSTGSSL
ncbi:MAG: GNAT family N-acetyltransferase [Gammaproteobacteria bacterium]|nr:GNAT family N-acetyltransferase [Gammaproteobacteria bacterium]